MTSDATDPDVVEVDLQQVGVVALYPAQCLLHIGGIGLLVRNWFVLGALDNACTAPFRLIGEQSRSRRAEVTLNDSSLKLNIVID